MAPNKKLKRRSSAEDDDRLNSLPDDILTDHILPLLPTREAARTSALASRWRSLWLYVPCLDFDAPDMFSRVPSESGGSVELRFGKDEERMSKYVQWVDQVIRSHRSSATLRHFRVVFRLGNKFARSIDSWIFFSLNKGVEALELDRCRHFDLEPRYKFPASIEPSRFPNIRLLLSLTLTDVSITDDTLEGLLRECESLERLRLQNLTGLTRVKVTCPPVSRLKSVDIYSECVVQSVTICSLTPDLVSFRAYWPEALRIKHAPRLVDLFIGRFRGDLDLISHPLFLYVSQLEALHLETGSWKKAVEWLPHLPDLSGLKHLTLTLRDLTSFPDLRKELRGLASVVNAAPCLQHLTLVVHRLKGDVKMRKGFAKVRVQLPRVIEIAGFKGRNVDCDLTIYLIKAAPSLDKLILNCRDPLQVEVCTAHTHIPRGPVHFAKEVIEEVLPSKTKLQVVI